MNPTNFPPFIEDLRNKAQANLDAAIALNQLVGRVKARIDRSDPLSLPLSQADVDRILLIQTPIYNTIKAAILSTYQALP